MQLINLVLFDIKPALYLNQFNQKPNSFLASNNNDLRRDIAMNEGKQNHQTSFFGNNQSQFTGSTAERSFLNLNVRDSLTTENIVGSIFDSPNRKQNKLQNFQNFNQKYQTQPQHTNMFNNNIANHSGYSQPSHLAFKQPTQQSFLNYDSFNNNSNPSPNKLAMIQQSQQYQQTSFFDHDFDCVDDGADNFYYSPQFHMHSNELRSNMTQPSSKLQISKFKQEINGLLSNDNSRLPSNRDNQAEYFSSNLSNKRNNFKSVDGLYDTQIQHIGTFSHDNTSKATTDNNFGAKNGTKNYQKFSNLIGSAGYQKTQHENHSFVLDNQDDSFIFRQDKKKKNSRSSSILGDNFLSNQNQQYELNSSYI